ncbi:MAG: PRC-barrel domain-containing protein [Bacillota bacterium]
MRALCDLVGLPVVNLTNGEVVGEIDRLYWTEAEGDITGMTVHGDEGLFYLPYERVDRIGQDAAFISCNPTAAPESTHEYRSLNGLTVYDQDGNELGTVDDLVMDLAHGRVSGLNVSGGLLRDIVQGQRFVPWGSAQLGKDAIIVDSALVNGEDGKQA